MAITAEKGTLEYAQQKEAAWKKTEIIVAIAMAGLAFFWEDAEVHEIPLGIAEGLINWRRSHWSNVVKTLEAGGEHPEADYSTLEHHINGARRKHADLRSHGSEMRRQTAA